MKHAAGILVYRWTDAGIEVAIVHPSGNYNRHKPWSIPKGLPDEGESLEDAARRETAEEAGITVTGELLSLGSIQYQTKSRKVVHGFAAEAWPNVQPSPQSWEVDRAEFVSIDEARQRLHPDQAEFLDRLLIMLDAGGAPSIA